MFYVTALAGDHSAECEESDTIVHQEKELGEELSRCCLLLLCFLPEAASLSFKLKRWTGTVIYWLMTKTTIVLCESLC